MLPPPQSIVGLFFSTILDFRPRKTFLYGINEGGEEGDVVSVEVLHAVGRSKRRCPRPFQRLNDFLYGDIGVRRAAVNVKVAELQTSSDIERACSHGRQAMEVLGRWKRSFKRSMS